MHIGFPFQMDHRGRTAAATYEEHVNQMIEQLLFTAPGERVNRPDFGTGLMQLVFGPNSPEAASAVEFMVQGTLQQWLGDIIQVESIQVESVESTLRVKVIYRLRRNQEQHVAQFSREV